MTNEKNCKIRLSKVKKKKPTLFALSKFLPNSTVYPSQLSTSFTWDGRDFQANTCIYKFCLENQVHVLYLAFSQMGIQAPCAIWSKILQILKIHL